VGTWAQGKESEQPANGWRERQLLAVAFRGHSSQQPHLQHATSIKLHRKLRLGWPLTLR
jgi:hypothetical protein